AHPVDGSPNHPVWRAIRDTEAVLVPEVTDETIARALSSDQGVLQLARDTGTTSLLLVPIRARGQVLGAVGLGTRGTRRHFDDRDKHLIEEIGKRAGLALDNARLLAAELRARLEAEAAHAEAERASRAKSDFLAMMSHELRTPLNAIAGYAELIEMGLRGPVTENQVADLSKIRQNQRHLLSLINSVLSFARIDAGRVMYDLEHVPVDAALRAAEPLVEPQLRARNLNYSVRGCESAVTIRCDSEKLQQVLLNLLVNATKFTPKGGQIMLSCTVSDDVVSILVEDNGVGIHATQLQSIFEPFVQGNRPIGTSNEGVGLGLAISREFARGMGGDITVASTLGAGSTFTLTLPRGPDRTRNA
ncbi:MAG: HAMP domain-containing sensor histidine kinase, partial [Gemmatimonadaceae bacterium]